MRSLTSLTLVLLVALAIQACAPKPARVETPSKPQLPRPAPSDLVAKVGDKSIELQWKPNQQTNPVISGYHIYISRGGSPFERSSNLPYPGDTNPDSDVETYPAVGLDNGVEYRFVVSTVYPNGDEVFSLDTTSAIPRPEGHFVLRAAFSGPESGFSFSHQRGTTTDGLENDVYLAVIKGVLYIASPKRIDDVLRQSKFSVVDFGVTKGESEYQKILSASKELVPLTIDAKIIVRTENGNHALLTIRGISENQKSVEIDYVYQTRPNLIRF